MSKKLDIFLLILLTTFSLATDVFAAKKPVATTESKAVVASTEPTALQDKIIPGRYQLFQGKYKSTEIVIGTPTSYKKEYVEGLFLLDTTTGVLLLCEEFTYANSESDSKASKGFIYKRHCSPFKDNLGALKDE